MILTKGFIVSAQNYAKKIAIEDGDEKFTYRQFSDQVSRSKQALVRRRNR